MENSFKSIIERSKSILVLLPTKPYFDQVTAGLALYLVLRQNKEIQIFSPSPMTVEFNRIIGINRITQELGNKNLIIRFVDYKANDIERVSYDIEDGQFRLTVIPKQRVNPPSKDQIELSYSGISADCVIMIGGANESHFPAISLRELDSANMVHIGIKDISLTSNKSYVSFSRPASSISEIVACLIKESGMKMDEDIATNLLMGMEVASNNFTDNSVNAETFSVVSELMRQGGKRMTSQPSINKEDFPQGSIPTKVQSQYTQPASKDIQQQSEEIQDEEQQAPSEWLQPKIYKGTSIS